MPDDQAPRAEKPRGRPPEPHEEQLMKDVVYWYRVWKKRGLKWDRLRPVIVTPGGDEVFGPDIIIYEPEDFRPRR